MLGTKTKAIRTEQMMNVIHSASMKTKCKFSTSSHLYRIWCIYIFLIIFAIFMSVISLQNSFVRNNSSRTSTGLFDCSALDLLILRFDLDCPLVVTYYSYLTESTKNVHIRHQEVITKNHLLCQKDVCNVKINKFQNL